MSDSIDTESINGWEHIYREAYRGVLARAEAGMPLPILGFHTTIDGLKRIVPDEVERVLQADPAMAADVSARVAAGAVPEEIWTPTDLLVGMLVSLAKGKALQRVIRAKAVHEWTMEHLPYDRLRAGGTCGNMVSMLAPLGFPRLLLYVNPLTREQAELLPQHDNVKVVVRDGGGCAGGGEGFAMRKPIDAWREEGVKAVHWIFEYPEGMRISVPSAGIDVVAPRANRYIASYNPINNQLVINPDFKEGLLALVKAGERFTHFMIAGFHILSEKYPDGSRCADCLRPMAEFISQVKQAAPGIKIHFELASIGSQVVRQSVMGLTVPLGHSLGLNEVELATLLGDLGETKLAAEVEATESPEAMFRGVKAAGERLGLARIHLHNLGYYLCISRPDFVSAERTRDGLAFAACAAAARTSTASLTSLDDVARGLEVGISGEGMEVGRLLGEYLGRPDLAVGGMAHVDGWDVSFVPTKVVERPALTVGLGDLISSSAFLLGT